MGSIKWLCLKMYLGLVFDFVFLTSVLALFVLFVVSGGGSGLVGRRCSRVSLVMAEEVQSESSHFCQSECEFISTIWIK